MRKKINKKYTLTCVRIKKYTLTCIIIKKIIHLLVLIIKRSIKNIH